VTIRSASARRIFRFGVFELDASSGELRRSGARLNVQDQPLQVLTVLLQRPGELVTREELRTRLWPSDTFVGFEHGLNAAVGRLRETLGDSAETPRFIETLPRRGYRFIAPVTDGGIPDAVHTATDASSSESPEQPGNAEPAAEKAEIGQRLLRWASVTSAGLVLLLGCWGAFLAGKRVGDRPTPTFHQLTFRRGGVVSARFTPDGTTVVYGATWDGDPVRLFSTRIEGPESSPLSLPDADVTGISAAAEMLIVINRPYAYALPTGTLASVPLAGGTPRPIAQGVSAADWSADGKQFAVSREIDGNRWRIEYPLGIRIYESTEGTWAPRISPDGSHVAFYGDGKDPNDTAVVMADRSGHSTILSDGWRYVGRYVAWSPNGDEVWFSATKGSRIVPLRAVSRSGRERVVLTLPGYVHVQDVSRDGRVLLAFGKTRREVHCRIAGEREERNLTWFGWSSVEWLSGDGKTLLLNEWDSTANGVERAYLRGTDGSPAVRLGDCVPVNLSPDGKWVVCYDPEAKQGLLIPTGTGQSRRMPSHGTAEAGFGYGWMPDSRHGLEAWRQEKGGFRTYLVDADTGRAEPLTPEGFVCTWASPDGKSALCQPGADGTSQVYSIERNQMRPVHGLRASDTVISWGADGRSLFVWTNAEFPMRVYRLDIDTGARELWREIHPPDRAGLLYIRTSIYMTPDGGSYCYTTQNALNDLYLVDGLQ
jgi:DNA-binding winged helix-turn-helix (wHTH) protein/Tol biopolymer transport system component